MRIELRRSREFSISPEEAQKGKSLSIKLFVLAHHLLALVPISRAESQERQVRAKDGAPIPNPFPVPMGQGKGDSLPRRLAARED